jgi:His-Xaa-Ser system protein HxsD
MADKTPSSEKSSQGEEESSNDQMKISASSDLAVDGRTVMMRLSKNLYEKEAVFAAAHKFTNAYDIDIQPLDAKSVGVYLTPKDPSETLSTTEHAVRAVRNEVIDQQIRRDLEKEYGNLRLLIMQRAFSAVEGNVGGSQAGKA